jgi:hypothetical protein
MLCQLSYASMEWKETARREANQAVSAEEKTLPHLKKYSIFRARKPKAMRGRPARIQADWCSANSDTVRASRFR